MIRPLTLSSSETGRWKQPNGVLEPNESPSVFRVEVSTDKGMTMQEIPEETGVHELVTTVDTVELRKDCTVDLPTITSAPDYPLDIVSAHSLSAPSLGVLLGKGLASTYMIRALSFSSGNILFAENAELWLRKNLVMTRRQDAYGNSYENEAQLIIEDTIGGMFKIGLVRTDKTGYPTWVTVDSPIIYHNVQALRIGGDSTAYGQFKVASGDKQGFSFGDDTDYLQIYPDGTLRLYGAATTFDDFNVPVTAYREQLPAVNAPILRKVCDNGAGSQGIYAYAFTASSPSYSMYDIQLPHQYKEGSDIYPHVHFLPKVTGSANQKILWRFEYVWQNFGDSITSILHSSSTVITGMAHIPTDDTLQALKHYITPLGTISGAGKTISSELRFTFSRFANDSADDYGDEAYLWGLGIHYEKDSLGSKEEYTK